MTAKQRLALRSALADLHGALQAQQQGDMQNHDWKSHELTITELAEAFKLPNPLED